MSKHVLIIGGGITGLTTANYLQRRNIPFTLLEASNKIGGRVQSKNIDGYTVDEGFQVFLTAYPEARALLDYDKLDLKYFDPGAKIMQPSGQLQRVGDPLRQLSALIPTMTADIGSLGDKMKLLHLRNRVKSKTIEEIFTTHELSSQQYLENLGVSQKMITRFFQPFFSGIFLESTLATSSRMLEFIYKMFSEGFAALPKKGMQAIADQLASNLPTGSVLLNHRVEKIDDEIVSCQDGQEFSYDHCVIATQASSIGKLVNIDVKTKHVGTTHLHFAAEKQPYDDKLIALNHAKNKRINTIAVLSNIQKPYASQGALISASLVGLHNEANLESQIKQEAKDWFPDAESWKLIDKQDITYALPDQRSVNYDAKPLIKDKIIVAGDHIQNGSVNAAMKSGRQAAEIISKKFQS